jgi:hypothetical protein
VAADSPREQIITHPPILCIEVLSPKDRISRLQDRVDDYFAMGVPHVWILDPESRRGYHYTVDGMREAKDGIFATPLRGLFVRVVDGAGNPAFSGSVSLDSDGRGEVPSLKPGVYDLRAESSGYAPVRLPSIQVPSATLNLLLTPGGSLEIQAGPATLALPQPTGRLIGADQRIYMWSAFTSDGKIRLSPVRRLENVAPGSYTFEVEGGVRRDLAITEGGRAVVSLP